MKEKKFLAGPACVLRKLAAFFKGEIVLACALGAAAASMLFVTPDREYLGYIDVKVLVLLFCLMAVVAGLSQLGLFDRLAQKLASAASSLRTLGTILVLLCFFSSMLMTNDVALLTFVPFAIAVLRLCGQSRHTIWIVCLQTVGANLGSMLTPVGNPQNLYLVSRYGLPAASFFAVTLPLCAASLVLLLVLCRLTPREKLQVPFTPAGAVQARSGVKLCIWLFLFAMCLASVLGLLPVWAVGLAVLGYLCLFARPLFWKIDYALLATFVCFFIFVGNLARIPQVSAWMQQILTGRELLVSVLASQVLSNVPAAVMLSGFTQESASLVAGTNLGGLGTLIASLASLISFKFYVRSPGAEPSRYLMVFTLVNAGLLVPLYFFAKLVLG